MGKGKEVDKSGFFPFSALSLNSCHVSISALRLQSGYTNQCGQVSKRKLEWSLYKKSNPFHGSVILVVTNYTSIDGGKSK